MLFFCRATASYRGAQPLKMTQSWGVCYLFATSWVEIWFMTFVMTFNLWHLCMASPLSLSCFLSLSKVYSLIKQKRLNNYIKMTHSCQSIILMACNPQHCWTSLQVSAGREWYIHTIYTVRSRDNANRGIGKRSVEYHHSLSRHNSAVAPRGQLRSRRSANEVPDIIEEIGANNNRGTNILHIALDRSNQRRTSPEKEIFTKGIVPREINQRDDGDDRPVLIIGIFVGLLLTVLITIVVVLLVRSKQEKKEVPKASSSTEPMMMTQGLSCSDSSEV